jgi:predicted DNA-binding protein YlxM (UPF0122 family)
MRLTPEQVPEIISRYHAGEKVREIAQRIGVTKQTVYHVLVKHNVTLRKQTKNEKLTMTQVIEIRRRYVFDNAKLRELADEYHVSHECIRNAVHGKTYRL